MPDIFDSSQLQEPASSDSAKAVSTNTGDEALSPPAPSSPSVAQRKQNAVAQLMEDLKVNSNPFGSFSAKPKNTCLDIQMQNEEVLLLMRKHPVTQIKWIVIAIFLVFLPFLFSYVPFFNFLPARLHVILLLGWFLMILGFSIEAFLDWFYNIYIVTNERVIDCDFNSLLFKNISTAKLDKVEDITVTNKGYLGSIFDYGTVLIQTAGAVDEFEFEDTPHPSRVSAFINDLLEAEKGTE